MVCVFILCILRPASFVKTAVHWSHAFSDLAVTEAKVGVIIGTVDVVSMERGGLTGQAGGDGWITHRGRCCSSQDFLLTSSRLGFSHSSGSLVSGSTLAALLLVSWATVALVADRGGRR